MCHKYEDELVYEPDLFSDDFIPMDDSEQDEDIFYEGAMEP